MNMHITPNFIIDRLCKTASVLLFLVLVQIPPENNTIMKKIIFVHLPVCAREKRGNRQPHLLSDHWPSRLNDLNVHV